MKTLLVGMLTFEWLRLARRELILTLLAFSGVVLIRHTLALASLAAIQGEEGLDLPAGVAAAQAETLAGYVGAAAIGTVVFDSLPLLIFAAGALTCWTLGGEFSGGTIRTALVVNPSRSMYLSSRLFGAAVLSLLCLALVIVIGLVTPLLGALFGMHLPSGASTPVSQLAAFLTTAALVVLLPAALGALLAVQVRSAVAAIAGFAFGTIAIGMLSQLGMPYEIGRFLPSEIIWRAMESTAPANTAIPSRPGAAFGEPLPFPVAQAVVAAQVLALLAIALAVLKRHDVTE